MFPEANKCPYIQQKTYKNYHYIRKDTILIFAIQMRHSLAYSWAYHYYMSFVIIMSITNT